MRPAVNARFGQRRSDKIARWPNRARTAGAGEAIACAGEAQKPAPDVKGELSCCRFSGRLVKLIPPCARTQQG
jgi:hypothetical protein